MVILFLHNDTWDPQCLGLQTPRYPYGTHTSKSTKRPFSSWPVSKTRLSSCFTHPWEERGWGVCWGTREGSIYFPLLFTGNVLWLRQLTRGGTMTALVGYRSTHGDGVVFLFFLLSPSACHGGGGSSNSSSIAWCSIYVGDLGPWIERINHNIDRSAHALYFYL